jgi:hypothetical protein
MNPPSILMLIRLQRAVEAARAASEALGDLTDVISSNGLNDAQQELLEDEVINLALGDPLRDGLEPRAIGMDQLKALLNALHWEQP